MLPQAAGRPRPSIGPMRRSTQFHRDAERQHELKLVEKPIMRWANDDDWSGDVFVWTHAGRPAVIGCILSGPSGETNRIGLPRVPPAGRQADRAGRSANPPPLAAGGGLARSAARRRSRARRARPPAGWRRCGSWPASFTAHMEADGTGSCACCRSRCFATATKQGEVRRRGAVHLGLDKGTDPEVILLLECRQTDSGLAWHFAPVRFSNARAVAEAR